MGTYRIGESPLLIKSRFFAGRITKMVDYLRNTCTQSLGPILNQVLRSGTSIMANISEAQFAQSQADFITKFHIALKEANETKNWLFLLHSSNALTDIQYESMVKDCSEIIAMLVASLNTSKQNQLNNVMGPKRKDK